MLLKYPYSSKLLFIRYKTDYKTISVHLPGGIQWKKRKCLVQYSGKTEIVGYCPFLKLNNFEETL